MKKFLGKSLLLLPLLFCFAGINYFIDPANIFNTRYVKYIAENLLAGKNVTNVANYDERLLQKYLIENCAKKPQIIILGSSRVLLIGNNIYKNKTCLNTGVSGAGLEDILAIYNLIIIKGLRPEKIIIGLDPWMLNDNRNHEGFTSFETDYDEMLNRLNIKNNSKVAKDFISPKLSELISLQYFQESLKYITENGFHKTMPEATDSINNKKRTILFNGAISYDETFRNSTVKMAEIRAKKYLQGDIYGVNNFIELSETKKQILTVFFDLLKKENMKVILFLSPYHPVVYNYFEHNKKFFPVLEGEKFFKKIALQKGFSVVGSFDPKKLNLDNSFFYDGMHCSSKALPYIFSTEKE